MLRTRTSPLPRAGNTTMMRLTDAAHYGVFCPSGTIVWSPSAHDKRAFETGKYDESYLVSLEPLSFFSERHAMSVLLGDVADSPSPRERRDKNTASKAVRQQALPDYEANTAQRLLSRSMVEAITLASSIEETRSVAMPSPEPSNENVPSSKEEDNNLAGEEVILVPSSSSSWASRLMSASDKRAETSPRRSPPPPAPLSNTKVNQASAALKPLATRNNNNVNDGELTTSVSLEGSASSGTSGVRIAPENRTLDTVVIGKPIPLNFDQTLTPLIQVMNRLAMVKRVSNKGFGVVPITNTFTSGGVTSAAHRTPSPPETGSNNSNNNNGRRGSRRGGASSSQSTKTSGPGILPDSPAKLPSEDEELMLVQIGMHNGRQAIFQTTATLGEDAKHKPRTRVEACEGRYVVFVADDGHDVGILRACEKLGGLVRGIPEASFTRVLRLATPKEIASLKAKEAEEDRVFAIAERLLSTRTNLHSTMRLRFAEFQFDRKKLILFVDMTHWICFNEFVKAVRSKCEDEFRYHARIFLQRRFVEKHALEAKESAV